MSEYISPMSTCIVVEKSGLMWLSANYEHSPGQAESHPIPAEDFVRLAAGEVYADDSVCRVIPDSGVVAYAPSGYVEDLLDSLDRETGCENPAEQG